MNMNTRTNRLIHFVKIMFPPIVFVPLSLCNFFAVYLASQIIGGADRLIVSTRAWAGAISILLFLFLFRLYDEVKDAEHDVRMAKDGDSRYTNRPIVTGEVNLKDIIFLRTIVQATLIAMNIFLGYPLPVLGFVMLFVVTWFSSKWFFWPACKNNLLLAFVTHNPLAFLFLVYAFGFYAADFKLTALNIDYVILLVGLWLNTSLWEISRKIRLPQAETKYQTYSMMLGFKNAVILTIFITVSIIVSLSYIAFKYHFNILFPFILYAAGIILIGRCIALLISPSVGRTKLESSSIILVMTVFIGMVSILVITYYFSYLF